MRAFLAYISALTAMGTAVPVAFAQTPATVNISVDATAVGAPLQPIWAFHGYDEVNYTTTAEGEALLQTLGMIPPAPPHIRSHFLLNTGNGVPSFKWGSTNVYTVDATGNPVYDWTLMDGIMDAVTNAGAVPFAEIGFMPEALSTNPTPYQNSGIYTLDGGVFIRRLTTRNGRLSYCSGRVTRARGTRQSSPRGSGNCGTSPDIGYWKGTSAEYDELFDYTESALHQALPQCPARGPRHVGRGKLLDSVPPALLHGHGRGDGGEGRSPRHGDVPREGGRCDGRRQRRNQPGPPASSCKTDSTSSPDFLSTSKHRSW